MWPKKYKDYPEDSPLKKCRAETGKGIVGVEMKERNGWGETHHPLKRKKGMFTKLFAYLFGSEKESLR